MHISVHSYRFKLLIYTVTLMLLLLGTLFYTHNYVRDLIFEENNQHLDSMTRLLHARIESEKIEFQRYAEIVAENDHFKEYMFAVVDIGTDTRVLRQLYEHQFGWLPVSEIVVLNRKNKAIIGDALNKIDSAINTQIQQFESGSRYIYTVQGLELLAYAPVYYQGDYLGAIVISRLLDHAWFLRQQSKAGGDIILVRTGQLLNSSFKEIDTTSFDMQQDIVLIKNEKYRIRSLSLNSREDNLPKMYFALQETLLFDRLAQHQNVMSVVIALSFIFILILGYFIVQNVNQPLSHLVSIIHEVARGYLPHLEKSNRKDEFAELSNHFADMLQALRDQQSEIEIVHAALEKTAITDSLTELYNRRQLAEVFPKLLGQAQRHDQKLFGIIIDLDKFKGINDLHGHLCGDVCLQHFSALLRENSRASDYLFRLGGEEFLVLTLGESETSAFILAEKIRIAIEQASVECENKLLKFTISCGVSDADLDEEAMTSMRNMLIRADRALFHAKNSGRNQVQLSVAEHYVEQQPSLFS